MSPSLPISIAASLIKGKPEEINTLPVTRLIQGITSWVKPGGVNIENPFRKAAGLPQGGQFDTFYVHRMLANMAAEGYSTDEINRAMVDQSGPLWTEALDRVGKTQSIRMLGQALWLDFFPEGELQQRKLQQEFSKAIDSGDKTAVSKFFEDNPEYRARLLMNKWDDPQGQLRNFMISDIWTGYRALPALYQKQLRDQLGTVFNDAFLSKETRSYDAIDTTTLSMWTKAVGGYLPKTAPGAPQVPLEFGTPQEATSYQQYVDQRNKNFPNIYNIQTLLYSLPPEQQQAWRDRYPQLDQYSAWRDNFLATHPEIIQYTMGEDNTLQGAPLEVQKLVYAYRAQRFQLFGPDIFNVQSGYFDYPERSYARKKYLKEHPELPAYWDWQTAFLAQYPNTIPYIKSVESIASKVLGKSYNPNNVMDFSNPTNTAAALPAVAPAGINTADFPPALVSQLMAYFINKQPLGAGALAALRRVWNKNGKPYGNLTNYLLTLKPTFAPR
jgi:hypothetical protein